MFRARVDSPRSYELLGGATEGTENRSNVVMARARSSRVVRAAEVRSAPARLQPREPRPLVGWWSCSSETLRRKPGRYAPTLAARAEGRMRPNPMRRGRTRPNPVRRGRGDTIGSSTGILSRMRRSRGTGADSPSGSPPARRRPMHVLGFRAPSQSEGRAGASTMICTHRPLGGQTARCPKVFRL